MKRFSTLIIALSILGPCTAFATEEHITTTLDINRETCAQTDKANKKLEALYQKLKVKYMHDKAFLKALEASQTSWATYRDAQIKMQFMPEHEMQYYGSRHTYCRCNTETAMAEARMKELQSWLDGLPGNACP